MNISKVNISEGQKKIIILTSVGLFVLLLLWIFLYLPTSKEINYLKSELTQTIVQIEGIEKFLSTAQNRDEAMQLLKQKEQYLNNMFPQKEEEALRIISELARKNNIDIVSLQPGSKTEFLDKAGNKLVIEGRKANYLPVAMEISCLYKDLVKYLLDLKSDLPLFVSVDTLDIAKDSRSSGKILVNITFNLYLLI